MMQGFRAMYSPPSNYRGAVVLRYVLWPWDSIPAGDPRETYPAQVLYGGPTTLEVVDTPQGRAFLHAMQTWSMAYGRVGYPQWVPIIPEAYGVRWPRRGWQWEQTTELEPPARYSLAGVPPSLVWRRVA